MDLVILLLLCCCMAAASLPAPTPFHYSTHTTHHAEDAFYDHYMAAHANSHSHSEGEFILSSKDAHDKRDLDALLSFRSAITKDPDGRLSKWTAENSENMCSNWYGIHCIPHTRRVVAIDLYNGTLQGTLTASLGNLSLLEFLDLSYNMFSGPIPVELGMLQKLEYLDLDDNMLSGPIPVELGMLQKLEYLDLDDNVLSGPIPAELGMLQKLEYLDLGGNKWSGRIPCELGNNLTGEIPRSIGSMSSLRLLNLSRNQLEGKIPASLSNISTLEQLDMAKNNLSGKIPQELSKLSMLAYLDVSSNNLCGPIPSGTQISTFNPSSFQSNKCLCGFPLQSCNEKDKAKKTPTGDNGSQSNIKRGWMQMVDEKVPLVALGMGLGIGFGGVVAMFIVWDKARRWVLALPPNNTRRPFYGLYRFPT